MGVAMEHLERTATSSRSDGMMAVRQHHRVTLSLATETLVLLLPAMIFVLMAFGMPEVKAHEAARGVAAREIHPISLFADQAKLTGRR